MNNNDTDHEHIYRNGIDNYEANLLKVLEEV